MNKKLHTKYPSGLPGGSTNIWQFYKPKRGNSAANQFVIKQIVTQKEQDNRLLPNFRNQNY